MSGTLRTKIMDICPEGFSDELKDFIDDKLRTIYLGSREINLKLAKQKLFNFLKKVNQNIIPQKTLLYKTIFNIK